MTSVGSDCASRLTSMLAPSRRPVLELELPALLAERGETELETTSTGLSSVQGRGMVLERARRDRRERRMEERIFEAGCGEVFG